jgi:hypothetical protein
MKYSRKRLTLLGRLAVVGGVFFFLFVVGYYTGYLREHCESDVGCFEERARECRPTDVVVVQDNNVYEYRVGNSITDCTLHVILRKVEAGAPPELHTLEGKRMTCSVEKERLVDFTLDGFDQYMGDCHGLLKEGLYELILTRVYSNLVGQMGSVIREAEKVLKK